MLTPARPCRSRRMRERGLSYTGIDGETHHAHAENLPAPLDLAAFAATQDTDSVPSADAAADTGRGGEDGEACLGAPQEEPSGDDRDDDQVVLEPPMRGGLSVRVGPKGRHAMPATDNEGAAEEAGTSDGMDVGQAASMEAAVSVDGDAAAVEESVTVEEGVTDGAASADA